MKADGSNYTKPENENKEVKKRPADLKDWLIRQTESFKGIIPAGTINPERFIRAAAIEIVNNPRLMACSQASIAISLGQCAKFGLEPGSLLGQAYLIPYNESKKGMTCHFQIGYKGLLVLARRSQTIKSVTVEVVFEKDFFDVDKGTDKKVIHKPDYRKARGEPFAYYAIAHLSNGDYQSAVMSKQDVIEHRSRFSKAWNNKKDGEETVWDTDFDAMALKTVLIKCLKLCPISVDVLEAVNREEQLMAGVDVQDNIPEFDNIPDADFTVEGETPDNIQPVQQPVAENKPPVKQEEKPSQPNENKILVQTESGYCYVEEPLIEKIIENRNLTKEEKGDIYAHVNAYKGIDKVKYNAAFDELKKHQVDLDAEIARADSYIMSTPLDERDYWIGKREKCRTLAEFKTLNNSMFKVISMLGTGNKDKKTPPPPPPATAAKQTKKSVEPSSAPVQKQVVKNPVYSKEQSEDIDLLFG